jgi:DNA-binding transcriptional regulator YiaG
MNETPLKTPLKLYSHAKQGQAKEPTPGTLAERVRHTLERLHLDDTRGAEYLGVPVYTVRKWITGEREPGAAVARLLDVLGMVEAMAPALHGSFMPAQSAHVKKSRTKKEITQ